MKATMNMASLLTDLDKVMSGCERYPVVGLVTGHNYGKELIKKFKGLNTYWNCLEKAVITAKHFGFDEIAIGSLLIFNLDYTATYGYAYNPPLEFHAWVPDGKSIIDFALPGAIEKGLMLRDSVGVFLKGRMPVILAGVPDRWLRYQECERHNVFDF